MSNASAQEDLRKFAQRWKTQPGRGADEHTTSHTKYALEPSNSSPSPENSPLGLASFPSKILERIVLYLSPLQIVKLRLVGSPCIRLQQHSVSHDDFSDLPAAMSCHRSTCRAIECDLAGVRYGPTGQSLELEERMDAIRRGAKQAEIIRGNVNLPPYLLFIKSLLEHVTHGLGVRGRQP